MSKIESFRELSKALVSYLAPQKTPQFSCGDCERNEQCGLPPHEDCTERLLQIARDGEKRPPRSEYLYPAMWPR